MRPSVSSQVALTSGIFAQRPADLLPKTCQNEKSFAAAVLTFLNKLPAIDDVKGGSQNGAKCPNHPPSRSSSRREQRHFIAPPSGDIPGLLKPAVSAPLATCDVSGSSGGGSCDEVFVRNIKQNAGMSVQGTQGVAAGTPSSDEATRTVSSKRPVLSDGGLLHGEDHQASMKNHNLASADDSTLSAFNAPFLPLAIPGRHSALVPDRKTNQVMSSAVPAHENAHAAAMPGSTTGPIAANMMPVTEKDGRDAVPSPIPPVKSAEPSIKGFGAQPDGETKSSQSPLETLCPDPMVSAECNLHPESEQSSSDLSDKQEAIPADKLPRTVDEAASKSSSLQGSAKSHSVPPTKNVGDPTRHRVGSESNVIAAINNTVRGSLRSTPKMHDIAPTAQPNESPMAEQISGTTSTIVDQPSSAIRKADGLIAGNANATLFSRLDSGALSLRSTSIGTIKTLHLGFPEEGLGAVAIQAHMSVGQLSAVIQVNQRPAFDVLSNQLSALQHFVQSSDGSPGQVVIDLSHDASERHASTGDQRQARKQKPSYLPEASTILSRQDLVFDTTPLLSIHA